MCGSQNSFRGRSLFVLQTALAALNQFVFGSDLLLALANVQAHAVVEHDLTHLRVVELPHASLLVALDLENLLLVTLNLAVPVLDRMKMAEASALIQKVKNQENLRIVRHA